MARPRQPLINRDTVIRTALAIIDDVGIEDFGLERLATELNIRAPSLYYHFSGKAEILSEVARLVTIEVRVPREPPVEQWPDWFIEIAIRFRRAVLRHPKAAPLLVQYFPRRFTLSTYERGATLMQRAGVPVELHAMVFEGLDELTFGAALIAALRDTSGNGALYPGVDAEQHPNLFRASEANQWDEEELLREALNSLLQGVVASVPASRARAR